MNLQFFSSFLISFITWLRWLLLLAFAAAVLSLVGCGGDQLENNTDPVLDPEPVHALTSIANPSAEPLSQDSESSKKVGLAMEGAQPQYRNLVMQGDVLASQYPMILPETVPASVRLSLARGLEGWDVHNAQVTAEISRHQVDLRSEPGPQSGEITIYGLPDLFSAERLSASLQLRVASQGRQQWQQVRIDLRRPAPRLRLHSTGIQPFSLEAIVDPQTAGALVPLRRYEFENHTDADLLLRVRRAPRGGVVLQYSKITPYQANPCEVAQRRELWRYRSSTQFVMVPGGAPGSQVRQSLADGNQMFELPVPARGEATTTLYALVERRERDLLETQQCRVGASLGLVASCQTRCDWWVPLQAVTSCGGGRGRNSSDMVKDCLRNTGYGSSSGGDFCVQGYHQDPGPLSFFNESFELMGRAIEWEGAPPMAQAFYRDIPLVLQQGTPLTPGFESKVVISGEVDDSSPLRLDPLRCL